MTKNLLRQIPKVDEIIKKQGMAGHYKEIPGDSGKGCTEAIP